MENNWEETNLELGVIKSGSRFNIVYKALPNIKTYR